MLLREELGLAISLDGGDLAFFYLRFMIPVEHLMAICVYPHCFRCFVSLKRWIFRH